MAICYAIYSNAILAASTVVKKQKKLTEIKYKMTEWVNNTVDTKVIKYFKKYAYKWKNKNGSLYKMKSMFKNIKQLINLR